MPTRLSALLILTTFTFSACTQAAPLPPTLTLEPPSQTAEPPTSTPSPSPTAKPTDTHTPEGGFPLPMPESTPLAVWEGITMMPGAIAGDELGDGGYIFITKASPSEIEQLHLQAMGVAGYTYIATATNEAGGLFIVFDQAASVSVRPLGDEAGTNYVVIIIG